MSKASEINAVPESDGIAQRQRWMGLLARADESHFSQLWNTLGLNPAYRVIRGPEEGLVMVRGRAGGSGNPFNLGEMTVTRCSIRLESGQVGHAYVSGRRLQYAEQAAIVDALMQSSEFHDEIEVKLVAVLEAVERERQEEKTRKAAATKVDFFTMVRGEDPET